MTDLPLGVEAYPEEAVGRSDAELITAVRSGDNEAYGGLFDRHVGAARSMARQLTRDPNEAEDLVAEAFAKVLVVLQGGGGPDVAFRAYLLTSLRRVAYDRTRSGSRVQVTDDLTPYDPGVEFVDPAIEGLEKSIVARAYASLPERWQTVLWHTEVEGLQPGEVAPLLGLTANGVAALAYRAREGLRQAYLQQHVMGELDDACRPYADKLGSYARGGLAKRETAHVEQHLEGCERCRALVLELTDVNHGMRVIVAPLVLGLLAAGYLKAAAAGGAAIGLAGSGSGSAAGTGGTAAGAAGTATTATSAAAAGATASAGAGMTAAVTGAAAVAGSVSASGATGVAASGGAASGEAGGSATVGYVTSTASSASGASAATGTATAAGTSAGLTVVPGAAATGGLFAGGGLLAGAAAAVVGLAAAGVVVAVVASTNDQGPVTALPPTTKSSVPVLPPVGGSGSGGDQGSSGPAAPAVPVLPAPAATSASPRPTQTSTPTTLPTLTAPTHTVTVPAPTTTTPTAKPEPTVTTEPTPTPTPTFSPMPVPPPTPPSTPPPSSPPPSTSTPPDSTPPSTPPPSTSPPSTPPPSPSTTPPDTTPPPTPPAGPLSGSVPASAFGDLVVGQPGWVGFTLTSSDSSASPSLSATFALPSGIQLTSVTPGVIPGLDGGPSKWTCTATTGGTTGTQVVCTYPALPPLASTTLALPVLVSAAPPDVPPDTPLLTITVVGKNVDPVVILDPRAVKTPPGAGGTAGGGGDAGGAGGGNG